MNYATFQGTGCVPIQYVFRSPDPRLGNLFGGMEHDDRRALWGGCLDAPTTIPAGGAKTFDGLVLTVATYRELP